MGKRLLLDTHALIWAAAEPSLLSTAAADAIRDPDNEVWVSAVSAYEIALKYNLGRLPKAAELARDFAAETTRAGYGPLALEARHARHAGMLSLDHRDPFDRQLVAQAVLEGMTLVSNEAVFDRWAVARLW